MLQKHLLIFLVFLFMVLGCASTETIESTKVAPTEIYQDYIIRGSKNSTNVTATFRVGGPTGSTVDLDAPGKVTHNGKEMNESKPGFLKGTDYGFAANEFISEHKFVYTDAAGKTWENEINLPALEINVQNLTFSKANGGTITLSRPVDKDENVEFSLVSEKTPPSSSGNSNSNTNVKNKLPEQEYSTKLQIKFDDSRSSIKIEPFSLKNFVEGKATVWLTVRKNKTVQNSAKGGALDFSYESQKIAVNLVN